MFDDLVGFIICCDRVHNKYIREIQKRSDLFYYLSPALDATPRFPISRSFITLSIKPQRTVAYMGVALHTCDPRTQQFKAILA